MKVTVLIPLFFVVLMAQAQKKSFFPVYNAGYLDKTLVYVPAGSFNYDGPSDADMPGTRTKTVSLSSFYIFPYEVPNYLYLVFTEELRQKDTSQWKKALPDTLVWRSRLRYNEPYVEYYFRHPAYRLYPLVGITHKQCELFCEWLTEKYNSDAERKHKKVKFRLPYKAEWSYAAGWSDGKKGKAENPNLDKKMYGYYTNNNRIFPWASPYMQDTKGNYLANFRVIDQGSLMRSENLISCDTNNPYFGSIYYGGRQGSYYLKNIHYSFNYADITAPVESYWPNALGIYNLAGNVEEFVFEKGITKGGSWRDTGYYLQNFSEEIYTETEAASLERGFRFVMEVVE